MIKTSIIDGSEVSALSVVIHANRNYDKKMNNVIIIIDLLR